MSLIKIVKDHLMEDQLKWTKKQLAKPKIILFRIKTT